MNYGRPLAAIFLGAPLGHPADFVSLLIYPIKVVSTCVARALFSIEANCNDLRVNTPV
jgi:hypothetical protein